MKSDISENVILYDWLTVSSKNDDPQAWVKLLGMESCGWDELGHGRNGYRKGLYFGSISILYDGNPGMGACLDMSGQGCRNFEEYGTGDFDGLFRLFQQEEGYHVSRLDVAFDDHSGILDIWQLFRDTDKVDEDAEQQFVSKFRKSKVEKEFDDGRPGITVYHGSKKSAILIRIYDKAAERGLPKEQHWVRVELQLRDERAEAFCFRQGADRHPVPGRSGELCPLRRRSGNRQQPLAVAHETLLGGPDRASGADSALYEAGSRV